MRLRDNIGISIIILAFICANAIFLVFYKDVWWDSSVYIGMGKYIYSLGHSGLWEDYRMPLFPLILILVLALALLVVVVVAVLILLMGRHVTKSFCGKQCSHPTARTACRLTGSVTAKFSLR